VVFYCANTTALHISAWKFSEGGRYVKLGCEMSRRMKKVENHCSRNNSLQILKSVTTATQIDCAFDFWGYFHAVLAYMTSKHILNTNFKVNCLRLRPAEQGIGCPRCKGTPAVSLHFLFFGIKYIIIKFFLNAWHWWYGTLIFISILFCRYTAHRSLHLSLMAWFKVCLQS